MKLKKIASLALAGIMAVSMLAGCSTTGNDDNLVPEVPASTTVVDYATDALDNLDGKLTFAESTWLDGKLGEIATNTSNFSATDIKNSYDGVSVQLKKPFGVQ